MKTNNSFSVTMTDENGNVHSLDGVLSVDIPQINAFECKPSVHIVGSGACKMGTQVSFENFCMAKERMRESGYFTVDLGSALNELAQAFKTCNEKMKISAEELRKVADTIYKSKPKPVKPYWRIGERW